jgi:hypothetical protein
MPFAQDINRRDSYKTTLDKYQMHPQIKELIIRALAHVGKDIERAKSRYIDESCTFYSIPATDFSL